MWSLTPSDFDPPHFSARPTEEERRHEERALRLMLELRAMPPRQPFTITVGPNQPFQPEQVEYEERQGARPFGLSWELKPGATDVWRRPCAFDGIPVLYGPAEEFERWHRKDGQ